MQGDWIRMPGRGLLAAVLLMAAPALAQMAPEPIEPGGRVVYADEIRYDRVSDVYEATGSVRIAEEGGRSLVADWVAFNATTLLGVASGNVVLVDAGERVDARFAAVDLESMTALALDAGIDSEETGFQVRGDALQKVGPQAYTFEKGLITTCRCPDPDDENPWEVTAEEADIPLEGYAVARNVTVKALGVPVLYVPWLVLPVKTERQTGFLIPSYTSGARNGFELETPFFWAPRYDVNVLVRPHYMSERGFKGGIETEILHGEHGFTQGGVAALPSDDQITDSNDTPFSDNRWAYWLEHSQRFDSGLRLGADVQAVSDNDYVVDFHDLHSESRTQRYLESVGWASYDAAGIVGSVEVGFRDDIQAPNNEDRDDFVMQRLPDVRAGTFSREIPGTPLRFGVDTRYTYFHQTGNEERVAGNLPTAGGFFDTGVDGEFDFNEPTASGVLDGADNHFDNGLTEGDGAYQEGELLSDFGHRLDVYPRVSLPLQAGFAEVLTEVGYRETFYSADRGDSHSRGLFTARVDARTRLARDYEVAGRQIRHVFEPRLSFALISGPRQRTNPLFIPDGAIRPKRLVNRDSRVLLQNPSDRIEDERLVLLGFGNRFFDRAPEDPGAPAVLGEFFIGGGYDIERSQLSDLFFESNFWVRRGLDFGIGAGYDLKESELDEAMLELNWSDETDYSLAVRYRYLRDLPRVFENYQQSDDVFDDFDAGFDEVNQLALSGLYAVTKRLDLVSGLHVDFDRNSTLGGSFGVQLHSTCDCWDLLVEVHQSTRPSNTEVRVALQIAGMGLGTGFMGFERE